MPELARAAGLRPVVTLPARRVQGIARLVSQLPGLPTYGQWVEALAAPAVVDTTRAREDLGWRPRWSGIDAWRDTLGAPPASSTDSG
jgi:nucleoside-diphosphate-sugar epimerase